MKISLICYFFDLIAKKSEIYKIQKWTQFWHEMLKIASVSGAEPQTPLGELTTLPRPPSVEGLLAFLVAKGFLLSAIAALRLRHSQFELLARSRKHPSF